MSLVDFLVTNADFLLALSTLGVTVGLFFLVKSGAGVVVPLSSSAVAASAITLHFIVFIALGFYWTALIVVVRAVLWAVAAAQRMRKLNGEVFLSED